MYRLLVLASSLWMLFWNLENFFDYHDNGNGAADTEWSSRGDRHWTRKRFRSKCEAVAKSLFWAGEEMGQMPDIVAVAEVENRYVLRQLIHNTALEKLDYAIVHYDSPDPRGIDVGLLYRRSRLRLLRSKPCRVSGEDSLFRTRDILLAEFERRDSCAAPFAVLVNHHPSKYGGKALSEPRRRRAVAYLRFLADSLQAAGYREIIACGDFNDTPNQPVYALLRSAFLNLAEAFQRRGEGSIRFDGKWEMIDMFLVSKALADRSRMQILRIPFLTTRDSSHPGEKPLRTYLGPRYIGGVSDHRPIALHIE